MNDLGAEHRAQIVVTTQDIDEIEIGEPRLPAEARLCAVGNDRIYTRVPATRYLVREGKLKKERGDIFDGTSFVVSQFSRVAVILLAVASLGILGLLDYVTGYEISFAVFYLVPVSSTAWYGNRPWAIAIALASSIVWYVAEVAGGYPYTHPAIPIWNACVRLAFFMIVALLLSALRERLLAEREFARTDGLTGLLNRRTFIDRLDHDLGIGRRTATPVTLAYIDVDDFKHVNDTHGHAEGDRLLRAIAGILARGTRRTDTAARLGGDEFALILPATNLAGARVYMRKLSERLLDTHTGFHGITCSIGAVVFEDLPESADEALRAADQFMYRAKRHAKGTHLIGVHARSELEPAPEEPTMDARRRLR